MKTYKILYILTILSMIVVFLLSCSNATKSTKLLNDTVEASVFTPEINDTTMDIDLTYITKIKFPKYKIITEKPIIPESISISYNEENVINGNYSAILNFDTLPNKQFYTMLEARTVKDTCWKIIQNNFIFKRKDQKGGIYSVAFSKGSVQIIVSHLNSDMLK